jgi:hypothetical protein
MSIFLQQIYCKVINFTFGFASFLGFGFTLFACDGVGGAALDCGDDG